MPAELIPHTRILSNLRDVWGSKLKTSSGGCCSSPLFSRVWSAGNVARCALLDGLAPPTSVPSSGTAGETNRTENGAPPAVSSEPKEGGLTRDAAEVTRVFGLPITNSMVVTWITALALIVFAQLATRDMKLVPTGAQNLWEWLVEALHTFLEGVIGRHLVERTFWFFASIFIFILATNWVGLHSRGGHLVGWGYRTAQEASRSTRPCSAGPTRIST